MSATVIDKRSRRTVVATAASGAAILCTALLLVEAGVFYAVVADVADVTQLLLLGASLVNVLAPLLIFVLSDVVATAASPVHQDIAMCRLLGAQKGTIRHQWARHVTHDSLVATAVGAAAGYPSAYLCVIYLGRIDVVPADFHLFASPLAGVATIATMAGIAYLAGYLAVMKISGRAPIKALADSHAPLDPPSSTRIHVGYLLIAVGGASAVAPLFGNLEAGAGGAGNAALMGVIGIALIGPTLVRRCGQFLARRMPSRAPYALRLAVYNCDGYAYRMAAGMTILAMALAVVMTYGLANTTIASAVQSRPHLVDGDAEMVREAEVSAQVNLVVLLVIFGFLLIGAASRLGSVSASRRAELHRLHQLGATRGQLRTMLLTESLLTWGMSGLAGVAVAAPILFMLSVGLLGRAWPAGPVWIPVVTVVATGVVILAMARLALPNKRRRPKMFGLTPSGGAPLQVSFSEPAIWRPGEHGRPRAKCLFTVPQVD